MREPPVGDCPVTLGFRPTPVGPKPVVSHAKQRPRSVLVSSAGTGRTRQDRSHAMLWQGTGNLGCPTRRARCACQQQPTTCASRKPVSALLSNKDTRGLRFMQATALGTWEMLCIAWHLSCANLLAAIYADSDRAVRHRGATRPAYKPQRVYCTVCANGYISVSMSARAVPAQDETMLDGGCSTA